MVYGVVSCGWVRVAGFQGWKLWWLGCFRGWFGGLVCLGAVGLGCWFLVWCLVCCIWLVWFAVVGCRYGLGGFGFCCPGFAVQAFGYVLWVVLRIVHDLWGLLVMVRCFSWGLLRRWVFGVCFRFVAV